jgi:hypothetical protein
MVQPLNAGLALAAVLAAITFCVHTFVGGPHATQPLLAARDLTPASRWLNYMCWHMVTVVLAVMAAAFAATAAGWLSQDVAALLAAVAASFSILSIAVTLKAGIRPWRFPSSYLLASVAAAGVLGLV